VEQGERTAESILRPRHQSTSEEWKEEKEGGKSAGQYFQRKKPRDKEDVGVLPDSEDKKGAPMAGGNFDSEARMKKRSPGLVRTIQISKGNTS